MTEQRTMDKPELETLDRKPEQPKPKSKEWLCGGTKIIEATKEEREYYAELDIACPGCPDCEPEQPNTELLIIKTIQGLISVIEHNLSKLPNSPLKQMAQDDINIYETGHIFELQKAFE